MQVHLTFVVVVVVVVSVRGCGSSWDSLSLLLSLLKQPPQPLLLTLLPSFHATLYS